MKTTAKFIKLSIMFFTCIGFQAINAIPRDFKGTSPKSQFDVTPLRCETTKIEVLPSYAKDINGAKTKGVSYNLIITSFDKDGKLINKTVIASKQFSLAMSDTSMDSLLKTQKRVAIGAGARDEQSAYYEKLFGDSDKAPQKTN